MRSLYLQSLGGPLSRWSEMRVRRWKVGRPSEHGQAEGLPPQRKQTGRFLSLPATQTERRLFSVSKKIIQTGAPPTWKTRGTRRTQCCVVSDETAQVCPSQKKKKEKKSRPSERTRRKADTDSSSARDETSGGARYVLATLWIKKQRMRARLIGVGVSARVTDYLTAKYITPRDRERRHDIAKERKKSKGNLASIYLLQRARRARVLRAWSVPSSPGTSMLMRF